MPVLGIWNCEVSIFISNPFGSETIPPYGLSFTAKFLILVDGVFFLYMVSLSVLTNKPDPLENIQLLFSCILIFILPVSVPEVRISK